MDRRDFLKVAAAVPAAAALPAVVEARPVLDLAAAKAAMQKVWSYPSGDWYVLIHPQQERDLRDLQARERWKVAHKAWRKDGKPPMTCQAVLDKYTPVTEWAWPARQDEIGSYENIRFIESPSVATIDRNA